MSILTVTSLAATRPHTSALWAAIIAWLSRAAVPDDDGAWTAGARGL